MSAVALEHLTYGNEIRIERARLLRMVRAGNLTLAEALEEPALQRMLAFDLLLALPSLRAKVRLDRRVTLLASTLYGHIQRGPLTRVEQLTERERRVLVNAYRRYKRGES